MRPTVRRIDLTQTPTTVEVWPTLDWLEPIDAPDPRASVRFGRAAGPTSAVRGPRGRSGLWDAMANAVQRARESSRAGSASDHDDLDHHRDVADDRGADVIEMTVDTPHLAYLARVACRDLTGRDDLPGADVIALLDNRRAEAS